MEPVVIETHEHILGTTARRDDSSPTGLTDYHFCTYLYMDGVPCDAVWWIRPNYVGSGQRMYTRYSLEQHVKRGGWDT